ncbi:hypothetical protein PR048_003251 [Dryococelus australis]|uniref:Integrase catalytic domain-containing protein n=1 Tax=Dryococelus australis TaxID=614101 RepID=A0ABQ9INW4_9NEOP|nr:hypothetical protein PR048_003251 [Dryococelus australis]
MIPVTFSAVQRNGVAKISHLNNTGVVVALLLDCLPPTMVNQMLSKFSHLGILPDDVTSELQIQNHFRRDGGTSTTVNINKVHQGKKNTNSHPTRGRQQLQSQNQHQPRYSKLKSRINYKELGIDRCGGNNHLSPDCCTDKSNLHCSGCQATGHVIKVLHLNTSQEEERKIKSIIESLINQADINISETYIAIAGRVWIRKCGLNLCNLDTHTTDVPTVKLIDAIKNMDQVAQTYPVLYNGKIGKIPNVVVSLKLRKGAQRVFHRERDVPYALMKKVDPELDTLEAQGVLTKVETSDWGSPLVVITKTDWGVCLYLDHKVEFNRIIDQILHDVPKTMSYFDDIIVHGSTREECQHNLIACLDQLQKFDLHLNQQKCSLFQEQIEYLDHVIKFNKISKSPGKVAAIVNMPRPKSTEDNTIFKWTSACEVAFLKLKSTIPVGIDASPIEISWVLSHIVDGHEHPIAFASRSLTTAEQNYFQLDKGALTIVFAVNNFFQYLLGRHFKLVTDNQPLTQTFNHRATLPKMTAAPININSYTASAINNEVKQLWDATIEQISIPTVTYQLLKEETKKDATLSTIMKSLQEENTSEPDYLIERGILFHVIDAKSKWAEIVPCSSAPTSKSSIEILKDIFSRNGFPEVMVLDNAMIFTSEEFPQFCKEGGIFQKFCAAGHPATNGLAECNVQTLKHRLATMSNQNMPIRQKVWEILFRYPGYTLEQWEVSCETVPESTDPNPTGSDEFSEGEHVSARYYSNNKAHWKCGKVLKKLGKLHYLVALDNGFHFKRHMTNSINRDPAFNQENSSYRPSTQEPYKQ